MWSVRFVCRQSPDSKRFKLVGDNLARRTCLMGSDSLIVLFDENGDAEVYESTADLEASVTPSHRVPIKRGAVEVHHGVPF